MSDTSMLIGSALYSPPLYGSYLLITHILLCVPLYAMSSQSGVGTPWFAFIPGLNLVLLGQIAQTPLWMLPLLLVPCVSMMFWFYLWMSVCDMNDKPRGLASLMLVPVVQWVLPFYFAFG